MRSSVHALTITQLEPPSGDQLVGSQTRGTNLLSTFVFLALLVVTLLAEAKRPRLDFNIIQKHN